MNGFVHSDGIGARVWTVSTVDLIVPVYRNQKLTLDCLESLRANLGEISQFSPRIVVVDDSPSDVELSDALRAMRDAGKIDVLISNAKNLGFVKSVNLALRETRERGASAILVNSDTRCFPGTLAELIAVANEDDQFGFVCPRSNNASICTLPRPSHAKAGTAIAPDACHAVWSEVKDYFPRYTMAPTAIGFFMLIKGVIVQNFNGLDERFGVGYEEENDLVMRAGKVGFRAVIANHAFAYHEGSASFSLTDVELTTHRNKNLQTIDRIHPEFLPLVRAYESSAEFRAELMAPGYVTDAAGRYDIVFLLNSMGQHHNGTNELITNVVKAMSNERDRPFNITLVCDRAAAEFHGLDELKNVRVVPAIDRHFAIAVFFGQPYDQHILNLMETAAPITIYGMLDVISLDSGPLRAGQRVEKLWRTVAEHSNGAFFISDHSYDTFARRFPTSSLRPFTRLLPTDPRSYADRYDGVEKGARHIWVAGNHFPHKDSSRTGRLLGKAFPTLKFVVLGERGDYPPNVSIWTSGTMDDNTVIGGLMESSVVVLPSFYEGFGFTLMHALAAGKPVIARDIPATREILRSFGTVDGVFLYSNDKELVELLPRALSVGGSRSSAVAGEQWGSWAKEFAGYLQGLLADKSGVHDKLVKRIRAGDMARLAPGAGSNSKQIESRWSHLKEMDAHAFVDIIYRQILNRPADPDGMAHHLRLIDDGISRRDIVEGLRNSPEAARAGTDWKIVDYPEPPKRKRGWFARRR